MWGGLEVEAGEVRLSFAKNNSKIFHFGKGISWTLTGFTAPEKSAIRILGYLFGR
jgi:hypothetical protein